MTEPATKPCPRCSNGTMVDQNGRPWRCAYCNGSGRVLDPEPSPQVEEVEW